MKWETRKTGDREGDQCEAVCRKILVEAGVNYAKTTPYPLSVGLGTQGRA